MAEKNFSQLQYLGDGTAFSVYADYFRSCRMKTMQYGL